MFPTEGLLHCRILHHSSHLKAAAAAGMVKILKIEVLTKCSFSEMW